MLWAFFSLCEKQIPQPFASASICCQTSFQFLKYLLLNKGRVTFGLPDALNTTPNLTQHGQWQATVTITDQDMWKIQSFASVY